MEKDYNDIIELSTNESNQYSQELNSQIYGLVKIDSIFIEDSGRIYDIYSTHYKTQREITMHDKIEGWETLIPKLKIISQIPDSKIKLTNIICEQYGYLFFSSADNKELYGVLKFKDLKIQKSVELDEENNLKYTWTNTKFYLNGKEIKNCS